MLCRTTCIVQTQNRLLDPWRLRLSRVSCCIFQYQYLLLGVLVSLFMWPSFFSGCCLPISRQFSWNGFGKGVFLNVSGLFYTKSLVFSEVKKPLVITNCQLNCKTAVNYILILFLWVTCLFYSCERHETLGIFYVDLLHKWNKLPARAQVCSSRWLPWARHTVEESVLG